MEGDLIELSALKPYDKITFRSYFFILHPTMMNTMYFTPAAHVGMNVLWILHTLSALAFSVGLILLLFWAYKHLTEKDLWKWGWILCVFGIIGCASIFWYISFHSDRFGMMNERKVQFMLDQNSESNSDIAQENEELEGKALFEKLQSKQANCTDLTDSDFELIGEYLMGQKLQSEHAQMNRMMKNMMGEEGEEQMHVMMAKNATGCSHASTSSSSSR